jgi:hypothetical protein
MCYLSGNNLISLMSNVYKLYYRPLLPFPLYLSMFTPYYITLKYPCSKFPKPQSPHIVQCVSTIKLVYSLWWTIFQLLYGFYLGGFYSLVVFLLQQSISWWCLWSLYGFSRELYYSSSGVNCVRCTFTTIHML